MYDIFYIGDNQSLTEQLPFAQQVEDVTAIKSNTSMYWLIEEDITITDYSIFDFKPDIHTKNYNHVWKWNQQNYGGVTLKVKKPKGFPETFHHNTVACTKTFNVLTSTTPGDYFETSSSTHVWCVDPEYKINVRVVNETAYQNLFVHHMFIRPEESELDTIDPEWIILAAPSFMAIPERDGTRQENFSIINFTKTGIHFIG